MQTLIKKPVLSRDRIVGARLTDPQFDQFEYEAAELGLRPGTLARQVILDWLTERVNA